ncbi:hypothetical protein CROQUDRAFT_206261 [Cronartium quercuum f. sp. fusiforme G11]|uniref:Disintegrin and metalloproteinase domain-containing protein B n=1 Tax=Cronartium quercuum f. sp. fusiforme G11 TaxID=708437 RepID=A0A9P6NBP7_9BASI|nr:hypothetical protein CROQUDRAFT_206261 [Cronartium quercuum f. sp. fusiforme G11]
MSLMTTSLFICLFLVLSALHDFLHVHAHSTRSPPIQQVFQLHSANLFILPRSYPTTQDSKIHKRSLQSPPPSNLRSDDSLLLRFSIPSSPSNFSIHFSLSLRPTPNLIHPDARINYHSLDPLTGRTSIKTDPLSPDHVMAYTGWVIEETAVESWWAEEHASLLRSPDWASSSHDPRVIGWARILVHDTSKMLDVNHLNELVWEGSFEYKQQLWHVKPHDLFLRTKHSNDVIPLQMKSHARGGLVAWREVKTSQVDHNLSRNQSDSTHFAPQYPSQLPTKPSSICGHDQLTFNINPDHDVYQYQDPRPLHLSPPRSSSWITSILDIINSLFGLPSYHQNFSNQFDLGSYSYTPPSRLFKRQTMSSDISGPANKASSNFFNSIGSTVGCPVEAKVVYIGVAADCTYVSKYQSPEAARMAILNNLNSLSALYLKSFNVSLGLVELNIQSADCPAQPTMDAPWNVGCVGSSEHGLDLNQRLSVFSEWRGAKGGGDGAGLWHLMTDCPAGEEVGVAWLGQLCKTSSEQSGSGQVTSGTGVSASSPTEWTVMAHEIGHNFGAIHDCGTGCSMSDTCCPMSTSSCDSGSNYIMSPSSSSNSGTEFSACSIGNICTTIRNSLNTTCLVSPGQQKVISLKQCGNGIVEPGEDCDPGEDDSPCCDSRTCKFSQGSVCDPKNSVCCTLSCQFASPDLTCRRAVNPECDFDEKCTGHSSSCPADKFVEDNRVCGPAGAGLTCASGVCTSRDQQCVEHGVGLGLKTGCPPSATDTCEIACKDPSGQADCILLGTNFVDGTSCGNGGRCELGKCKGGKPIYENHPPIKSLLSD